MPKLNGQIINKAIRVAKDSDIYRGKVGAVIFTNSGHVLTCACNCRIWGREETRGARKILTIHAERFALAKAFKIKAIERYGRNNVNMLVVRVLMTGALANAKPCAECQFYLDQAGIRVWYSDINGKIVPF